MTLATLWALTLPATDKLPGLLVKGLAILGGAFFGGVVLGILAQLISRLLTTQKLPVWGVRSVRLLGAVVGGWLIALWMLGSGNGGFGGKGGFGFGSGENGDTEKKEEDDKKKNDTSRRIVPGGSGEISIEILDDKTLAILKQPPGKTWKGYRIKDDPSGKLYDIEELKEHLPKLPKDLKKRPLKVWIVLYTNSPGKGTPAVADLKDWLKMHEQKEAGLELKDPEKVLGNSPEVERAQRDGS